MCRNYRIQRETIETAKEDTPDVFAIYEDHGENLTGLVKVFNKTLAILYAVDRYGDIEYEDKSGVANHDELTPWLVRKLFGLNDWGVRNLFEVVPC